MSEDAIGCFFTRAQGLPSVEFWQELLRGTARVNPQAQQFYCLPDFSASALVVDYPRDTVSALLFVVEYRSLSQKPMACLDFCIE